MFVFMTQEVIDDSFTTPLQTLKFLYSIVFKHMKTHTPLLADPQSLCTTHVTSRHSDWLRPHGPTHCCEWWHSDSRRHATHDQVCQGALTNTSSRHSANQHKSWTLPKHRICHTPAPVEVQSYNRHDISCSSENNNNSSSRQCIDTGRDDDDG